MKAPCSIEGCDRPVIARGICQPHYDRKRRYGDLELRPAEVACPDCGQMFPSGVRGNRPTVCHDCRRVRHAAQMLADRRRKTLQYGYGLSLEDYDRMLTAQGGCCAICGRPPRGGRGNKLAVDHDHETGKVRALLCSQCNTALGLMDDNPRNLTSALNYLEAHRG